MAITTVLCRHPLLRLATTDTDVHVRVRGCHDI
jgi:hypothetical protein